MRIEGIKAEKYQKNFTGTLNKKSTLPIQLSDGKKDKLENHNYFIHVGICFLIYSLTFFGFYLLRNKSLSLDASNFKLFLVFISSMVVSAVFSRKFSNIKYYGYGTVTGKLFFSLLISLTFLIIFFNLFEMQHKTPAYILGATFFGLIIETFYFKLLGTKEKRRITFFKYKKASIRYLLLDFLILYFFCFAEIIVNLIAYKNINLENEISLVILIFVSWLISATTTHKFLPLLVSKSKLNAFELQVKFYLQFIVLVGLSMFTLHLNSANSVHFINAVVGYTFFSAFISMFVFAPKVENKIENATGRFLKNHVIFSSVVWSKGEICNQKYSFPGNGYDKTFEGTNLKTEFFKEYENVYSVLDNMLEINSFHPCRTIIINSDEPDKEVLLRSESYELFVNLHVLNDQFNPNNYLRKIRNTLVYGGVFVGTLYPHQYRYKQFLKKYSFWWGNVFYFFDLVWKRVFPKLPATRRIYFKFRKEKDQAISLAEGLGRLVYTGYKIINLTVLNDVVYFAAAKDDKPTPERKSFYSPIFKMERIGKNGKLIYVYKLRTMNPYSEFIQDFVFQNNNLQEGGKFKDDFRIPGWGKFLRKSFIDELPMLLNWIKGDLKLVGVRPISNHYLSLYTKAHQERRKKFKPGLVPPFYADLPETIKEIELSEKRYMDSYEKNPVKTDIKYLLNAVVNILIKKKRSA